MALAAQCTAVLTSATKLVDYLLMVTTEGALARRTLAAVATSCKPATLHGFWSRAVEVVAFCHQQLGEGSLWSAMVSFAVVLRPVPVLLLLG